MNTIREVKAHFTKEGKQKISNEITGYMFCKRADGIMFQMQGSDVVKQYATIDGLAKAALYRIKRG